MENVKQAEAHIQQNIPLTEDLQNALDRYNRIKTQKAASQ
jgi:ribosomal 50S subunit-associated protein YjgA (DUF615 family)